MRDDCLIIGGGIIGLLTARELATAGANVTLIEAATIGREASWAGAGILSPLYPWRYPQAVNDLASLSQRLYPKLAIELHETTGIDVEWLQTGLLILDPGSHDDVRQWSQTYAQPWRPYHQSTGVLLPQIGQIRNPRLCRALHRDLIQRGVKVIEQTPVERLVMENDRIIAVEAASARYTPDQVVMTAGAWSGQLLQSIGIDLPVNPVRGQMLLYKAPPGLVKHIQVKNGHYLVPRRDGHILIGSTVEQAGFDRHPTDEGREQLQAIAIDLVPELADIPIEQHWAALRPGSPKGIPYIGQWSSISNLYLNTGHFRNGLTLAPAAAQLLAATMQQQQTAISLVPYLPTA